MRATILPWAMMLIKAHREQSDGQGVYCGMSTDSEVFLDFTTQLYTCLCNYNAIVVTS